MKKSFLPLLFFFMAFWAFGNERNEVVNLSYEIRDNSVFLFWQVVTSAPKTLALYRSPNPFKDFSSLADAVLLSTFSDDSTSFIDNPVPNTNYYYALLFIDEINANKPIHFVPGKNSILSPVHIFAPVDEHDAGERDLGLPLLNIGDERPRTKTVFSAKTENKIKKLNGKYEKYPSYIKETGKTENLTFFRFPSETDSSQDVKSLSLKRILDKHTEEQEWGELEKDLVAFLRLSHTDEITARAEFYLAESYYFQAMYDKALLTFLQAEDRYEKETKVWIQTTLSKMREN